jgi:anti-anti-sigma factor
MSDPPQPHPAAPGPAQPDFDVHLEPADVNGTRVRVVGEIDLAVADRLERQIREALSQCPRVRLDLSEVTFIDSSGIRAVLMCVAAARGDGRTLEIDRRLTRPVARTIQIAGIGPELWPPAD